MPQVGFELTTLVFERAKTVHALDRATIVIGSTVLQMVKKEQLSLSHEDINFTRDL
jgi:hypothetical protein